VGHADLVALLGRECALTAASEAEGALVAALAAAEHTFPYDTALCVDGSSGGSGTTAGAAVDVRDSADAWVRIVLYPGDALVLAAGVHRRVVPAGSATVVMPTWPADADRGSRQSTVRFAAPVEALRTWLPLTLCTPAGAPAGVAASLVTRYARGSAAEAAANVPHFERPGTPHTRQLVTELCESFYHLGWVTGTGGSISIRHGDRIFMAPSGVQKERMQPQDIFVLDVHANVVYAPVPLPGKPTLNLSQCAPLFHHAFTLRNAGACIHTHDINAVMATLANETEWRITHQEMIKGIAGHGFLDECVVPIIENTPHECDLADSLEEAMRRYPRSNAVLVRRHGVYVWGASWEAAKTQAECYHYLFDASVRMRAVGLDPAAVPRRIDGIGAATSYGTAGAGTGGAAGSGAGGAARRAADATSAGFHGAAGTATLAASVLGAAEAAAKPRPLALADVTHVLLDIEGTTTPIAFVKDVLFPYAASHVRDFLAAHWGTPMVAEDVAALARLSAAHVAAGREGAAGVALSDAVVTAAAATAPNAAAVDAVVANVKWLISVDSKEEPLKTLQGHIWRAGYASGELKGTVYDDVPGALGAWVAAGKVVCIYSSGSVEAQRLLFGHTVAGDMTHHLSGYYDTKVGLKVKAASYTAIAEALGVGATPSRILFATDAWTEAMAATAAGLQVVITDRPGNAPLPADHGFPVVTTLAALL